MAEAMTSIAEVLLRASPSGRRRPSDCSLADIPKATKRQHAYANHGGADAHVGLMYDLASAKPTSDLRSGDAGASAVAMVGN
ncbi:hypothetical protein CKY51_21505 [Xanthomonas maliensis]|nr:hypothetical protein CKY51_21505 [Xanthomonas maliensis]